MNVWKRNVRACPGIASWLQLPELILILLSCRALYDFLKRKSCVVACSVKYVH